MRLDLAHGIQLAEPGKPLHAGNDAVPTPREITGARKNHFPGQPLTLAWGPRNGQGVLVGRRDGRCGWKPASRAPAVGEGRPRGHFLEICTSLARP